MERWSAVPEEGVVLGRVRVYDESVNPLRAFVLFAHLLHTNRKDVNGDPKIEIHLEEPPTPSASTSDLKGRGRISALPTEYKLTLQNTATKNMFVFGEKEEEDEETGDVGHRKRRRKSSPLAPFAYTTDAPYSLKGLPRCLGPSTTNAPSLPPFPPSPARNPIPRSCELDSKRQQRRRARPRYSTSTPALPTDSPVEWD